MSTPYFLAGRLDGVTYTCSEGDEAGYPSSNLSDGDNETLWQSDTQAEGQTLVIDFGSARTCDTLIIHNHNIDIDGNGSNLLQADDNSGFSSPETIATLSGTGTPDPKAYTFTAKTYRYWRILYGSGSTLPLGANPYLGNLFLGERFEVPYHYGFGSQVEDEAYETFDKTNLEGKIISAQAYSGRTRFSLKFQNQDSDFVAGVQALLRYSRGRLYTIYFVDLNAVIWLVKSMSDFAPVSTIGPNRYDLTLPLQSLHIGLND